MASPSPKAKASIILAAALAACALAAWQFRAQWEAEPLFPSPGLTETRMLSDWHPPLRGTRGDTEVYIFDSGVPGGTLLVCGGTHPNEPAGYMAAVAMLENLEVLAGRVILVARSNPSGFTHADSQEAALYRYGIETPAGRREFRNGSRFTNPVHQWPDPTIYINPESPDWLETWHPRNCCPQTPCAVGNPGPGGQLLAGVDSRNLNRAFPGDPRGTLTEQIAHAIMELIRAEDVDLALDYHEASPEYPTINVMVAHERASSLTAWAELGLSDDGINIATETSTLRLRGLSHREWGDMTDALAILFETANVAQGRLKGRTTEAQIVDGFDTAYARLNIIQQEFNERVRARNEARAEAGDDRREAPRRILQIEYPPEGIPLALRVGRHLQATIHVVDAYNMEHFEREIVIEGLPPYPGLLANGLGPYLAGPNGEPPAWRAAP